ncbi:MAG: hypothetical protein JO165_09240 [Candidatus Eremiobacteraeota bacterium]|nr:hypothetical protein [Candidatus Eremiobacteraeota bacterium]
MRIITAVLISAVLLSAQLTTAGAQETPSPSPSPTPTEMPSVTPSASATPPTPATLSVSANALNLHPLQTVVLAVTNATGVISATADAPLAQITVDQNARTVTVVAGAQTGSTVVHVSDQSGTRVDLPLRIAQDAARVLSQDVTLRVTGTTDPAWLGRQIQDAVTRNVQRMPGVTMPAITFQPPLLSPGGVAAVLLNFTIPGGDQYYDVPVTMNVNVQSIDVPAFQPPLLFYDDDPEHIVATGLLYRGRVTANAPARLYYYHENSNDPHRVVVVLTGAGSGPSTVQLIDASAGPNIDVMSVGHAVTRDFLLMKPGNEGVVVDVPAGAPYILRDFALNRLDGVAGTVGIRVLNGGAVDVAVVSAAPTDSDAQILAMMNAPRLAGDGHNRTGVFDLNAFTEASTTLTYAAGSDDASVTYGAHTPPSAGANGSGHDYGEYGVLRSISFNLTNPSPQPATVYIYQRPMGGAVRSSFLVDGSLVQLGCARVSDRYQIASFTLDPGASRRVNLLTMTDGGSNYPIEVGATSTPPQASTPPISAPDGCFPKAQPAPTPLPQV